MVGKVYAVGEGMSYPIEIVIKRDLSKSESESLWEALDILKRAFNNDRILVRGVPSEEKTADVVVHWSLSIK